MPLGSDCGGEPSMDRRLFRQVGTADNIVVNTRSLTAALTGVQRYGAELSVLFGEKMAKVSPSRPLQGIAGHVWEQFQLPLLLKGRFLWSPANSGPVMLKRQVVTIHDIAVIDHPEWFNARFAAWYRWMTPRLVRRAFGVIAVSEFTKRRLVEVTGVDESRVSVVPNGVDERFNPRSPEEVAAIRHRLGIPSSRYVLSLATLEPRKNLAGQLEAWARCESHLPDSVWLVISGGKGKEHVFGDLQLHNVPPRVHFTGYVRDEDLPALYSGAMALLYPSFYEGFGLPVLEAMASGTVPIVSNLTAPQEVAGDAGIGVNPHDHDSIASAIARVVRDGSWREELRHRAIRRSEAFSWARTAKSTWRVLEEAAQRNVSGSVSAAEQS
jgi:glycosyltransferase involved in cell wall biosynthesis